MRAQPFVSLPLLLWACTSSEGEYAAPKPEEPAEQETRAEPAQMAHKAPPKPTAAPGQVPQAAESAALAANSEPSQPRAAGRAAAPKPEAEPSQPAAAEPEPESNPVEEARIDNPYAFPQGGAVADAADRVNTVRLLVDGLGQKAQSHIARMNGQQPDRTGSTRIDEKAEKEAYLRDMRNTYRRMRELMHAVARCPTATPEQPVYNRSAPVRQLAEELDRYERAGARGSEASRHGDRLEPIIVNWKSLYIDPETAQQASKADWRVPRQVKVNWCPTP